MISLSNVIFFLFSFAVIFFFFSFADATVQVLSLTVFGSVVAADPGTPEITEILMKCSVFNIRQQSDAEISSENKDTEPDSNQDSDNEEEFEDDSEDIVETESEKGCDSMSWLLEICLRNLHRMTKTSEAASRSVPVRVESLQVVTVLARKYFSEVMSKHLAPVMTVLLETLSDSVPAVCFHSGQVIDALGNSMNLCLQEQGEQGAI